MKELKYFEVGRRELSNRIEHTGFPQLQRRRKKNRNKISQKIEKKLTHF